MTSLLQMMGSFSCKEKEVDSYLLLRGEWGEYDLNLSDSADIEEYQSVGIEELEKAPLSDFEVCLLSPAVDIDRYEVDSSNVELDRPGGFIQSDGTVICNGSGIIIFIVYLFPY